MFRKLFLRAYMVDNLRDLVAFPRQAARKQFVEKDAICVDIVFEVIFTLAVKALRAHPRSGSGRSARLRSSGGGHNAVLVAYYLATIVRVKDDMHVLINYLFKLTLRIQHFLQAVFLCTSHPGPCVWG